MKEIKAQITKKFPLSQTQASEFYADLREHIFGIAEIEKQAVEMLQVSMN